MEKILVVEDEKDIREEIVFTLKNEGYETVEAENGLEALQLFDEAKPDLIISDIRMPEMDGLQLVKNLRSNPQFPLTPFIFLTVLDKIKDIEEGLKLGAVDYITKPYNRSILLLRVKRQLEQYNLLKIRDEENHKLQNSLLINEQLIKQIRNTEKQIVHDIRSPLATISMAIDSLTQDLLDEKTKKNLNMIKETANSLQKKIEQILNECKEEITLFKMTDLISDVKRGVTNLCNLKMQNINFSYQGKAEDYIVKGERGRFAVAVDNILKNALKYSKKNAEIVITLDKNDSFVLVKIRDQGPGLTKDQIGKLRTDPKNVGNKPTDGSNSNGTGMEIVYNILDSCGGNLAVESKIGEGSTFVLHFPFKLKEKLNSV